MSVKALAFDIGAESGRAILGHISDGKLVTEEVHRFPNRPLTIENTLRWDIQNLTDQVLATTQKHAAEIASVGIDTWGVDYVLLDQNHNLLETPYHYRDHRTDGLLAQAQSQLTPEFIYQQTGIQFLPFNSLYQLLAQTQDPNSVIHQAKTFQTIPDYLHFQLTQSQNPVCEFTNATTTQCFNPQTGKWATELLDKLNIPSQIFPPIVPPGTQIGTHQGIKVIAPPCHDTASAVVAIPISNSDSVWISSGTWSILGTTQPQPFITPETLSGNWTNEGGYNDTYRLCKNVAGLWLIQSCRAEWEQQGQPYSYSELTAQAEAEPPTEIYFDPDHPTLIAPRNMLQGITSLTNHRNESPAITTRAILENLAYKYRSNIESLESITKTKFQTIHIVGGGSQIDLLNQLTADVCGIPVVAGPVEATAIGNLVVQLIALGELNSIDQAHQIIRQTFPTKTYKPQDHDNWNQRYQEFKNHLENR